MGPGILCCMSPVCGLGAGKLTLPPPPPPVSLMLPGVLGVCGPGVYLLGCIPPPPLPPSLLGLPLFPLPPPAEGVGGPPPPIWPPEGSILFWSIGAPETGGERRSDSRRLVLGCLWMVSSCPSRGFKYWICWGDGTGIKLASL